ncbi:MAG: hypothetical protein KF833_21800 [Verrucomicrobiae bacterium]|nr:hypothetical protein [Verrucomicrobiae bacterium]
MTHRRSFLRLAGGAAALGSLSPLGFLGGLPTVSAEEARIGPEGVRLHAGIEPLVRLLEDTPRERVIGEVAMRLRQGVTYPELLAALLLAGVRNIQPRPVGFKFHAVLVVNSAHLASMASSDRDRWLPIFWAIDQFKSSQAQDRAQGDWTLAPVDESRVPPAHRARQAFIEAMENWDEAAADVAIAGLARTAGAHELFDLFCRLGVRDFRDIGHKAIYVANSFRTLEVIGWHHAEPVLRSLAYALLDRGNDPGNPARSDYAADRPFRSNLPRLREFPASWLAGRRSPEAARHLIDALRTASPEEAGDHVVREVRGGIAPESLFEACLAAAGERMIRAPGIVSLHAVTFTNAVLYAWTRCSDPATRRLLLLQNASFLPLFRGTPREGGVRIDDFQPLPLEATAPEQGLDEVFAEIGNDRLRACRKLLAWLETHADSDRVARAARHWIFLKGRNSHDYKFSSAVLEDLVHLGPALRHRFLASSLFYFRGPSDPDNPLTRQTQAALAS